MMDIARAFGLDFYPMRLKVCPADVVYTFGAYGMPTRYTHWSFGKMYHKMKLEYDLGLSRIYELVINSDPCYAFLLDSNSLLQNKSVRLPGEWRHSPLHVVKAESNSVQRG
ncbi:hypothetical protein GCM10025857_13850 [Alicyclobacillus contaminans]|nr:hypothetical protein GCM10025857_13850 [Alicyclobacillus contaminans]